jgi:putative ABC transport system permease protein
MEIAESLRMALRAVRSHPLRSSLTTLGVVIGVAAVIVFVTLGTSLQVEIVQQVSGDRAAEITVWSGPGDQGGPPSANAQPVFPDEDLRALRNVSGVEAVVPQGQVPVTSLRSPNDTVALRAATATTPAYFDGRIADGRSFRQGEREVVLNPAAASSFDPNVSVGDRLRLTLGSGEHVDVTVVGITEPSAAGLFGFTPPPQAFLPTDPFYAASGGSVGIDPVTGLPTGGGDDRSTAYPLVTVRASDPAAVNDVEERVTDYLRTDAAARGRLPDGYRFFVRTNQELVSQVREVLDTLTAFVTGIAIISLVVGIIGIANVMLVSVTERTREIGIMKAVGAQNRDVLELFLVEAVVLGVVGAALGALVGVAGGWVATEYVGLPLVFPPEWAAIAVAVGIVVGAIAGLYPAWRAARTDPIEALRYE